LLSEITNIFLQIGKYMGLPVLLNPYGKRIFPAVKYVGKD